MSPEERDDIRLYLAAMEESSPIISDEWLNEIKRRSEAIKNGETNTTYVEVMREFRP